MRGSAWGGHPDFNPVRGSSTLPPRTEAAPPFRYEGVIQNQTGRGRTGAARSERLAMGCNGPPPKGMRLEARPTPPPPPPPGTWKGLEGGQRAPSDDDEKDSGSFWGGVITAALFLG